ncbi:MAG: DUF1761 domain-containing protein [Patescibacteria group bacterium]
MQVEINWLAVALATLSSMVVGSIWYAKPVLGNIWIKLAKIDEKKMQDGMARIMALALLMSFLAAFVIAHVAAISKQFYEVSTLESGLATAFWLWIGISVTTVVVHDIFERRPGALTLLTIGNQFFTLMAMGLIIGALGGF